MVLGRCLPRSVRVIEVGPRDGFQTVTRAIPTEVKVEIIDRLVDAGVREIEAASFVSSRIVPQMGDAVEVIRRIKRREGARYLALVPNLKGAMRALQEGVDGLRFVVGATESFNRRNVNMSISDSIEMFGRIVKVASDVGVSVSGIVSVAFVCPFEGFVPKGRVVELARRMSDLGSVEIGIADTVGEARPAQVESLAGLLRKVCPGVPTWLHLHDSLGLGLVNAVSGMREGIRSFDTSFGGIGGCPVVPGTPRNISTEGFGQLCDGVGICTGIDLDRMRSVSKYFDKVLRDLPMMTTPPSSRISETQEHSPRRRVHHPLDGEEIPPELTAVPLR